MKMKFPGHINFMLFGAVISLLFASCKSSNSYNAKYEAAWAEVIQSEDWKSSLSQDQPGEMYADGNTGEEQWLTDNESRLIEKDPFEIKYDSWVSRAYLKIIAEAEAADNEIKTEYDRFIAENPDASVSTDENVVKIMKLYKRKYEAHKSMLEGLKSWHALDSYGSDDLKFFKEENRKVVQGMYRNGRPDDKIIDFLVYKLADLYHLE